MSIPESGLELGPEHIASLVAEVRGAVLLPRYPRYQAEISTFNQAVEHNPAVVVAAESAADVQAAVCFAAAHGLPVGVLATGHQPLTAADGGVLITTRRMNAVAVDPATRTVRVEAGARWGEVVDHTTAHGLAPLAGSSPLVGVIGYVLGGGHSPMLGRTHGWAADHVRALEMVTPDGRLRHVTADSEPDLFWAVRGSKSNFGVVTAVELELFPVTATYAGGMFFEGRHAAAVLEAWREMTVAAPDELNSSLALLRMPDLPFVPELLRGRLMVHVRISYVGLEVQGARLLEPLRATAPAVIDTVRMLPFAQFAEVHQDPTEPMPYGERGMMLADLPSDIVETILRHAGPDADCAALAVELRHLGGALAGQPQQPNAVCARDARYSLLAIAAGGPEQSGALLAPLDPLFADLEKWSAESSFLNFMTSANATQEAYTPEVYQRLRALKAAYDPGEMFRLVNHKIPAAS
jgi:UDP-N-acetylenolpyruvoylglucosamine reductase